MCCCTWQPGTQPKQLLHALRAISHCFPTDSQNGRDNHKEEELCIKFSDRLLWHFVHHVHHAHAFCGLRWADFSVKQGGGNKVSRHANGAKHKQAAEAQRGASNFASFLMRVVSEHCGRQCPYFVFALLFFFQSLQCKCKFNTTISTKSTYMKGLDQGDGTWAGLLFHFS